MPLDVAPKPQTLVLCSNPADAFVFDQAGWAVRDVSVTPVYSRRGADVEPDPRLDYFERIVLALPRGSEKLRDTLSLWLDDARCLEVHWPPHMRSAIDINPTVDGDGFVDALVFGARPMWIDEVCTLDDVPDPEPETMFTLGLPPLDYHGLRVARPAFVSVIGPYGSGKSVLLRQMACHFVREHGWRVLLTSFEEQIKPRYLRDLRRHLLGDRFGIADDDEVARVDAEINDHFRFLRRKRGATLDADRLLDRIALAAKVYGVDAVIIDPVNEIDHVLPPGISKTDYMGEFIMRLKQVADDHRLLMIVAAHPAKSGTAKRSTGSLLTLNDAADTAHFGNKSDLGLCVWRADGSGPTFVNVDKVKDHETMGRPVLAALTLERGRFGSGVVGRAAHDMLHADSGE